MVAQGVIDNGYRGELYAGVWNPTQQVVGVEKGERVAQLIIMPLATERFEPVIVDELNDHTRGTSGFGSTGR